MKRFSCAAFVLMSALLISRPVSAQVQGQWASAATMQSAREFNAQVKLANGKVLSIGGVDNSGNLLASAELYNSGPNTWTLTGSMAAAREYFPAVVLANGKVLVSGGLGTGSTVLASAELYDPSTGVWSSAGNLSVARVGHTATLLSSGKVLVTGGCTSSLCGAATAISELYDPTSNSWSTTGNLITARYFHDAVRLKTGKVLVVGGSTGSATSSCELYNPSTGTWSSAASMTTARFSHATTLLADGKVLVTGGTTSRFPINSAELYNPTANTWTLTGAMITGRYGHTATLLTDGTVLVAGGEGQSISCGKACTSFIPTWKVEIYNEATGKFTAAASLSRALAYHSATLLGTGRALANGGSGTTAFCCVVVNTAQDYTPLSMTFSSSSLNFGFWQMGLTSPTQTVTVTNVSNHSVKFTSITRSGDFFQSNTCPSPGTLSAGQNCTITVSFSPTAVGLRNGAVTLNDNSPGSPQQTIALSGTGGAGALTFTSSSLNLGNVVPGFSSTQNATVINDGAAPVNITGFSFSSGGTTFTATNNCPATLNPQQTCVFQIVFAPPDAGTFTATLTVTDNGNGAPATISLTGTGID
ncbi:MAG TPA: kelch repeat-containing protein [Candidatus Acidoferrales bacterium]|nr:kelch repeat-containing protein [Candidatus Acidoferrales bacterium]